MTARALTIAGSDPTGGAGIQQDLRTFAACGVWGMSAITSVTVQDTTAVYSHRDLEANLVRAQIDAVANDIGVDAAKSGMLATAETVDVVARAMRDHVVERFVVDPVLMSSSGGALADDDVVAAIRELLLPRALVVTPNTAEAFRLTGESDRVAAARALRALGARNAIVTGGEDDQVDILVDASGSVVEMKGARVDTADTHGTGCVFSAALTAGLALGESVEAAARRAKHVVTRALENSKRLGKGSGPVDPGK